MKRYKLSLWLADAQATQALGESWVHWLRGDELIYLVGDLGAGKTTLSRGILRGLGHLGPVKSPTYTLLEPYELASSSASSQLVFHFDFYRINDPGELDFIGLDEIMDGPGIKLVEWPQHAAGRLPPADHTIELALEGSGRRAQIC